MSLFYIDLDIDLEFESGAHTILHENCHHQITYCKLNLQNEYAQPYEGLVRDFRTPGLNARATAVNF